MCLWVLNMNYKSQQILSSVTALTLISHPSAYNTSHEHPSALLIDTLWQKCLLYFQIYDLSHSYSAGILQYDLRAESTAEVPDNWWRLVHSWVPASSTHHNTWGFFTTSYSIATIELVRKEWLNDIEEMVSSNDNLVQASKTKSLLCIRKR